VSLIAPVSVIIPCHDAEETILRALQSVGDQTVHPAEVIVADDASADGTPDLLARCGREPLPFPLKVVRIRQRSGPGLARNAAWREISAASRYVAFLDADDVWLPRKLEVQLRWMDSQPSYGWSAHACSVLSRTPAERTDSAAHEDEPRFVPLSRQRLLFRNPVATPSVMARCPAPSRFRSDWDRCEDLMLWLDWIDTGYDGALLDASLALLGRPPKTLGGLTGDLRRMFASELRVLDTLVAERRMSACTASLWRILAGGRYQARLLRACQA
jgi:glycosyltransferase involved in cell wall biosynthesis